MKTRRIIPADILTPTLRFWVFHTRGWVKITLRPGQSLTARTHSTDEEGYSTEAETRTYGESSDGTPAVVRQWGSWGRDCDGSHRRTGQDLARVDQLREVPACANGGKDIHGKWIHRPRWSEAAPIENYDEFAEAAGY